MVGAMARESAGDGDLRLVGVQVRCWAGFCMMVGGMWSNGYVVRRSRAKSINVVNRSVRGFLDTRDLHGLHAREIKKGWSVERIL